MNIVIESLLELQKLDQTIRELEARKSDLPHERAVAMARVNGVKAELAVAKNKLEHQKNAIGELDAERAETNRRLAECKAAQIAVKSNRELLQMAARQDELERSADMLANRMAGLGDDLPTLEDAVASLDRKYTEEERKVQGVVEEFDRQIAAAAAELERAIAERPAAAKRLQDANPRVLLYYERLRMKRWPVVVRLAANGVCEGCHTKQPPFVDQQVEHVAKAQGDGAKALQPAACTMCGRLLYRDN